MVEKLAYVMANPVAAGLVRDASEWSGVRTLPSDLGRASWTARRPKVYFTAHDSAWPPEVSLHLVLPPAATDGPDAFRKLVGEELERAQSAARAEVAAKGWSFRGANRLLRGSPYHRATSWEPLRDRHPTFAVGGGQRQAFFDAVKRLRLFRQVYREARENWLQGLRDVVFSLRNLGHAVAPWCHRGIALVSVRKTSQRATIKG